MGNIVWLASYPKSGNTWLRVFLANYLANSEQPVEINHFGFGWLAALRQRFDEDVGIASAQLTANEIDLYRPAFHKHLSARSENPTFVKVHDAYTYNSKGQALFPKAATAGVIYLVRNPLDVVGSYAHHNGWSVKHTIHQMNCEHYVLARSEEHLLTQLHQRLLSWGKHVSSWTKQTSLPLHLVRYEDMVHNPTETFAKIVAFSRLPLELERLQRALAFSHFDKLKEQEETYGFGERSPKSASFFRQGKVGTWQTMLTEAEVQLVIDHHGAMMKQFNYEANYGDNIYDNVSKDSIDNGYLYSADRNYFVQRAR
ncbi:MAG: sulfotransferase domain-containing protein [Phormidesmis sp.]